MNQRIIIYIILSAILLYLYYRRQDITVFAAFIVVVATTLIFRDTREGLNVGNVVSGGGGGDACENIGFTAPKIDKNDIKGSLEKVMKNVKTVADKYMKNLKEDLTLKEPYNTAVETIEGFKILKSELEKLNKNEENKDYAINFGILTYNRLVMPYIMNPSEKAQDEALEALGKLNKKDDLGKVPFTMILNGGPIILGILNTIKKSNEMKKANKGAKKLLSVGICSVEHFISLWTNIQKATADGGGGGDADKDEDEKPTKNTDEE